MKFDDFLKKIGKIPAFRSELLLSGVSNPEPIKVQICRWVKAGKLIRLRRGLYLLDRAYRKEEIFEPGIAAILKKPSYISLEKALEYHGLIPEAVGMCTSVTTKRPDEFITPVGAFSYRHVKKKLFWGYHSIHVHQQTAFMADPEKAVLDYFYLNGTTHVTIDYIREMRLQNFEKIMPEKFMRYADNFKSPGIMRVANIVIKHRDEIQDGEKQL